MILEARGLRFSFSPGGPEVVDGVDLSLQAGEIVGVVGPNGAGKSTLVRLCVGLLAPAAGTVTVLDRPLDAWARRELARHLAVVPQETGVPFPFTVTEMVMMGRAPHLGRLGLESPEDREIVAAVLEEMDLAGLAHRTVDRLSGGERQRVLVARALAQAPRLLLCDEPTAHLDLSHQARLFQVLRARGAKGLATLVVLHDLNLAAAACDRLVLLQRGRVAAEGPPGDVLDGGVLEAVYGTGIEVGRDGATGRPYVLPCAARTDSA